MIWLDFAKRLFVAASVSHEVRFRDFRGQDSSRRRFVHHRIFGEGPCLGLRFWVGNCEFWQDLRFWGFAHREVDVFAQRRGGGGVFVDKPPASGRGGLEETSSSL